MCADTDSAANCLGRPSMVARDHEDTDAGGLAASDGIGHLGARRIPQQHKPEERHILLALPLGPRQSHHAVTLCCVSRHLGFQVALLHILERAARNENLGRAL